MARRLGAPTPAISFDTPAQLLADFLKLEPQLARVILAGLAVLAAAAIFAGWRVDIYVAVQIGAWIVGFGALLSLVAFIVSDPTIKRALSWFVVLFFMVMMTLCLMSAAFSTQLNMPPVYCLIRFWEYCGAVGKSVAESLPGAQSAAVAASNQDRVTSFRLQLADPAYEEGGARTWLWKDDHWEERYPSGKFDRFVDPSRLTLDGCAGTSVVRSTNRDKIFIPDKGCPAMVVRWQRGESQWNYLGQMRDIR